MRQAVAKVVVEVETVVPVVEVLVVVIVEVVEVAALVAELARVKQSLKINRSMKIDNLISENGMFVRLFRQSFLNDEPKLYKFMAEMDESQISSDGDKPDLFSSGVGVSSKTALYKAVFEAIERYCLSTYRIKDSIFGSYKELTKSRHLVNPNKFCYFSAKQLASVKFTNFKHSIKQKYYWVKCKSIKDDGEILLPTQTVYCPYKFVDNEPCLCFPITTGASLGKTISEALYKGICEVIERDSYMTNYLLSLKSKQIEYKSKTKAIQKILSMFDKYNLEVRSFVLESDFKIPTIMSVIVDKSKNGPAISIGLKTEFCLEKAILGSIEEAFQIRYWIRLCMIENNFSGTTYSSHQMLKRARIWSNSKNIKKMKFILKSPNKIFIDKKQLSEYSNTSFANRLKMIKKEEMFKKVNVYYKDITISKFKLFQIKVIKCIIPELHPMFIDHDFSYLGGNRIELLMKKYNQDTLNTFPHPFL